MKQDTLAPVVGEFSSRGAVLHMLSVLPDSPSVRGVLVFLHGFTDHCGRHAEALATLTRRLGFALMAYDMRGHGHSGPHSPHMRSYIRDFNVLVNDLLDFVLDVVRPRFPGAPIFLMGHSMGGCVCTLAACRRPELFAGLVLSSPLVQILPPSPQNSIKEWLVWAVNWIPGATYMRIVPRRPIEMGMSDPEAVKAMKTDTMWDPKPYMLGSIVSCVQGCRMLQAEARAVLGSRQPRMPVYVQQGTMDAATPHVAIRRLITALRALRKQAPAGKADGAGAAPGGGVIGEAGQADGEGEVPGDDGSGITYLEVQGGLHDLNHDKATPECLRRLGLWLEARL